MAEPDSFAGMVETLTPDVGEMTPEQARNLVDGWIDSGQLEDPKTTLANYINGLAPMVDPTCPMLAIVYDGDHPWFYGKSQFVKGEPMTLSARDAKSIVSTYPQLFHYADTAAAEKMLLELTVKDAADLKAAGGEV